MVVCGLSFDVNINDQLTVSNQAVDGLSGEILKNDVDRTINVI